MQGPDNRAGATVVGAIIGGVVGSTIGKGSGRSGNDGHGATVGAVVGNNRRAASLRLHGRSGTAARSRELAESGTWPHTTSSTVIAASCTTRA